MRSGLLLPLLVLALSGCDAFPDSGAPRGAGGEGGAAAGGNGGNGGDGGAGGLGGAGGAGDLFPCGDASCDAAREYCRIEWSCEPGTEDVDCVPLPGACGEAPSCACLAGQPCNDGCQETGPGLTTTCGGG